MRMEINEVKDPPFSALISATTFKKAIEGPSMHESTPGLRDMQ